ncbi:MAG: stage II sporulation protein R [Oscillospiraceae bacterium]|nr:stage II sporulation protein R [Oscillospiraceae bacterium]
MFKRYMILAMLTFVFVFAAFTLRVAMEQRSLAACLIRLHVVAASDEPTDQSRKLRVRDALLPRIAALTADCSDADAAATALRAGLPQLQQSAFETLGTGEPVTVSLQEEPFPRRDYDSFSLPAGRYRALRVVLGAGQGHNWWCVAFPGLCLPAEPEEAFCERAAEAGLRESEIALVSRDTAEVHIKFRLLDWLSELF